MKRLLLLFAMILTFSSCENRYVSDGRSMYEAYFDKVLKDPSSLKIYNESYTVDGVSVKWTIDYGAKNSFGAMDRQTIEFKTNPSMLEVNGELYTREELNP